MGGEARAIRIAAVLLVTVALVTSLIPAGIAEGEVKLPPPQTGVGYNDVRDEPDEGNDANGFPNTGFTPGSPTQVLDAYYVYEPWPADVDVNNLLRVLTEEAGLEEHREDHIYFGFGYFAAWWGWWWDKGSGGSFQDQSAPGTGPNPLASGANGAIDDAHDNDDEWENSPHDGAWDEFVWRGDNPWADSHPFSDFDSDVTQHDGDRMFLFISPGTHQPHARQMIIPGNENSAYIFRNDKDPAHVPDMEYVDNTDFGPYRQEPYPQEGGWATENRRPVGFYDNGFLVATEVTTSVNPDAQGDGYDRYTGDAVDVDVFSSVHPAVETLYRTTVWDPPQDHRDGDGDEDNVYPLHDQGPKQHFKDVWTEAWLNTEDVAVDTTDAFLDPGTPAVGVADDALRGPHHHEPNQPGDNYGFAADGSDEDWATHDPGTSYGIFAGDTDDYYEPGGGQDYGGYHAGEHAWVDVQPGYGIPVYLVNFNMWGSFNWQPVQGPADTTTESNDRGNLPGFMSFAGHFGTWWDANGDTWVGDIDEPGRWTSTDDPYNHGAGDPTDAPDDPFFQTRGEDPNDYFHTPSQVAADDSKQGPAEWRPLCEGGTLTVTAEPLTSGQRWGQTGVYVVQDSEGGANPYDDVVADVAGGGPWGPDGDGDQLSRLVFEGSIDIPMKFRDCEDGLWFGGKFLLSPTGTIDYPVKVTSEGEVTTQEIGPREGTHTLTGETVEDVDVVGSALGD